MVIFPVDDVTPAGELLPTLPLGDRFTEALVVGGDPTLRVLETDGVHPLLSAVGRAFADHRPLVLSPDAVWLTIMQGLAQHVRLHAEELRPRLVSHAGRKRLTVVLDGPMPRDAGSWQSAVESFDKLLAAEIDNADVFECDFSTSTDVERVAGRIVLLDAYAGQWIPAGRRARRRPGVRHLARTAARCRPGLRRRHLAPGNRPARPARRTRPLIGAG